VSADIKEVFGLGVAAKLPIGIESFQKIRAEGDPSY